MEDLTIEQALKLAEECCVKETDGHFTLMRFTTGWKAMMGTPDLSMGNGFNIKEGGWGEVLNIATESTIQDAVLSSLHDHAKKAD
jgi:hypothetical protein